MNPSETTNVRTLSAEQARRLRDLHRHVSPSLPPGDLVQALVTRLSAIIDAKAAFVAERNGRWVVLAESAQQPRFNAGSLGVAEPLAAFASSASKQVESWRLDGHEWTLVRLSGRRAGHIILILEHDWTGSAEALRELAVTFFMGGAPAGALARPRLDAAGSVHRFASALASVSGLQDVCELVLRYAVEAVPSRVAAIALPTETGDLAIVATFGYALALVEHLRIPGGTGVMGAVYQNGTPLVVADVTAELGEQHRRHRYRTKSFMAVPIVAGTEVLGVISMTDRADDRPFTPEDVAALSVLLAPAALALQRERVHKDAQSYAHAAMTDPVSGIFNRWYFHARLDEELHRAARHGAAVGVLMIDIDRFKQINDTFGHQAGDTVIRNVAQILRGSVRLFDVCARFGGDEFAVIMPDSTMDSAAAIAERIRQRMEAFQHDGGELAQMRVTVSVGATVSETETGAHDLVHRADQALYAAKRAGTNRVHAVNSGGTVLELSSN